MASAWIGSDMGAAWMHWRKKNKRAWRWCLCCRSFSLSRCKMQMQYSEQEYTLRVQRIQDYMIGHVTTARCTGLNLSLSQLKKHTLSFYGDYNVASCLPTRSTFGEYITFQGEKSRKKKEGAGCFLSFDQGKKFQSVDFWRIQGVVRSGILWSQTNEFI